MSRETYTLISRCLSGEKPERYYVAGVVERYQLSEGFSVIEDDLDLSDIPEDHCAWCLLDLPRGVLRGERDPADEAACRADHQMDQERDDRLTGDR